MRRPAVWGLGAITLLSVFVGLVQSQVHGQSRALFSAEGRQLTGGRVFSFASADLDGDGRPDIVVPDFLAPARVLFNDAKQAFAKVLTLTNTPETAGGCHGVAIADFNGDRKSDLFLVYNGGVSRLLLGDGKGGFVDSGQAIGEPGLNGAGAQAADVDGDGDVDVLVRYYQQPDQLYLNDGKGVFTAGQAFEGEAALGDVDGDGDPDVVCVPGPGQGPVTMWLNTNGRFVAQAKTLDVGTGFTFLELADVDGDRNLDLVLLGGTVQTTLWQNDGRGTFHRLDQTLDPGIRMTTGDVDLDGDVDLVVGNALYLNTGRGRFEKGQTFDLWTEATGLLLVDVDGDRDLDLLACRGDRERGVTELLLFVNRLR